MKLFSVLMVCLLLAAGTASVSARDDSTSFCPSAIYVEVLGQGVLYTVNYDHRLTQNISLRAGFTSWSVPFALFAVGELKFTGFPVMVNYLSGEETGHLELGVGVIPATLSFQGREIFFGTEVNGTETMVLGTATFGYRAQPRDGGFVFRIGMTPLFTFKEVQIWGGLSLGYAF